MNLPQDVKEILNKLEENGYEAYVVGGCVRDTLLGNVPNDWDICTNAKPTEVMEVFSCYSLIPTGLQHGTITVMLNNIGYEITTYRIDGEYSDCRRPDSVSFTSDLAADLSRRDFTINAMAYSDVEGLVDLFDGVTDLRKGVIKCVGNPFDRFKEDALRIIRAMRFASVLNFKIDYSTKSAMLSLFPNLERVAIERINAEFSKLLLGSGNASVLLTYSSIVAFIIPEVNDMIGFVQNNPYHYLDVWRHTLSVLNCLDRKDLVLCLSAFFHDIGKPSCYVEEHGVGHFYKHTVISSGIAESVLKRLRYSNAIIEEVKLLILYHDVDFINSSRFFRRMLSKMSKETLESLIILKKADIQGQSKEFRLCRLAHMDEISYALSNFNTETECFSLKQVLLDGNDLITMGFKRGKDIGLILSDILSKILDEELENDHEVLKNYVWRTYK